MRRHNQIPVTCFRVLWSLQRKLKKTNRTTLCRFWNFDWWMNKWNPLNGRSNGWSVCHAFEVFLSRIAVQCLLHWSSYWELYWITGQWQFKNSGFVSEPLLIERTYEGEPSIMSLGAFVTCDRSVFIICIFSNRRLRWFTRQMEN
jgi:hypothetical protein